ncbi:hypothetical protein [Azotobacter beijerinckii]|uniref:hypothetical protein n=1 Tax=Azotobacter beijerinckii TaxID=170623 RepID=UPI0029556199|nr:hypothetical protein [Azotobacter beijerinckii]MDV7209631.1 hypothetical protein [Azotobacter beijerinckii]
MKRQTNISTSKKSSLILFSWISYIKAGYCSPPTPPLLEISLDTSKIETVFEWKKDKCFDGDIPDSPARAFKSKDGSVFLYTSHPQNTPLVGKHLNNVTPSCKHTFFASTDQNPENFDDLIWLQTFYTKDGSTIYSLGSSDYHGTRFKICPKPLNESSDCWWSAIILATSTDGGNTFSTASPPKHVIARAPHKFSKNPGKPAGFFTTSNIIYRDNFYYTLIYTYGYKGQKQGNCLIRTDNLSNPLSWRTWDGSGFNRHFVNPEHPDTENPEDYTCTIIPEIKNKVRSLLWHETTKQYIAIYEDYQKSTKDDTFPNIQFKYTQSKDLLNWSQSKTLYTIKTPQNCKKMIIAAAYPSILDPDSRDMNFGTISNHGFLYFTRFNPASSCKTTFDRDLVRIPLTINSHE